MSSAYYVSNDELFEILCFLDFRDLIFGCMDIDKQISQQTIAALNNLTSLDIHCTSDDLFCIQYMSSHGIHLKKLRKVTHNESTSTYIAFCT